MYSYKKNLSYTILLSFYQGHVLQKLQLLFQKRLEPLRDCPQFCRLFLQCYQLVCSSYSSLYVSQARKKNAQKKWDRFSPCKQRSGHYEMVTAALWEVCHLREIFGGENMTVFCSTCAATGEWARKCGFGFARAEGDVRDEWQMGKRLLTHIHPREQKPCTCCGVCTQFDDLRTCPQMTGTHIKKCKTVPSATCGNIQKVKSR